MDAFTSPQALLLYVDLAKLSDADRSTILNVLAKGQHQAPEPEEASYFVEDEDGSLAAMDERTKAALRRTASGRSLETATERDAPAAFPITEGQGRALLAAIDDRTKAVLRRIAELYDPVTGRGHIQYPEIREILFGIPQDAGADKDAWTKFTKGHRSGLHRSLRHVTKDADAEMLIAVGDTSYFIDAPAILVLRNLFGIN